MLWLEGLGKLKKLNNLTGTRTRDLPDCSIAPQPSTLPRAPVIRAGNTTSKLDYEYTRYKLARVSISR
jgi:hypothetical protein